LAAAIALIVGLGNPGPEYERTRHNAGFWLVDRLAAAWGLAFRREAKFQGAVCRYTTGGSECRLLKPMTYMNLSGDSVAALARFFRLEPEAVLVAHDELDLPPGTVRLKRGGGDGGHNGLRDITGKLGSNGYGRLRIGIGHPGNRNLVTPFVLSRPPAEEECQIQAAIEATLAVMPDLLDGGFSKAMNHLNRRQPPVPTTET
jgi:PTH1 family peptidyl-tRNA hydrolase